MSRVRDMLRGYYGKVGDDDPSNDESLDGAGFKPEKHVKKLFAESNLKNLVSKTQDMREEIKQLDDSMQLLVFQNYNKFISATDTIRQMKGRVEGMDKKTNELDQNITNINESSDVINTGLADRRTKIEELNQIRGLLKKLQFIFELPARMQRCIDQHCWTEAVQCYISALPHLEKHSSLACFSKVHVECTALISQLKVSMEERISDDGTSPEDIAECITLLIRLHSDPVSLRNAYITSRDRCLELQLIRGREALTSEMGVLAAVDMLSSGFLGEFKELCRSYKSLFAGEDEEENIIAMEQLRDFTTKIFGEFFRAMAEVLGNLAEQPPDLLKALAAFNDNMAEIDSHVPEAKLVEAADKIIWGAIDNRVGSTFTGLEQQASECLKSLERATSAGVEGVAVGKLVNSEYESFVVHIQAALRTLSPFLDVGQAFMNHFTSKVVQSISSKTNSLFVGIGTRALSIGSDIANDVPDVIAGPTFAILAAKICRELEQAGVEVVAEKLQLYCANSNDAIEAIKELKSDLSPKLAQMSTELMTQFVEIAGHMLSQEVARSIQAADWFATNDGAGDCLVAGDFLKVLSDTDERISQLFPGRRATKPSWRSLQGKVKSYNFNKAIAKDIDKLFAKKEAAFSPLEFKRDSILSGIVEMGLKTLIECMRMQTLGTPGLHLIQIDTYVLRLILRGFTDQEGVVDSMLDETISSAAERCLAPAPLESQVLESLCEPKLVKLLD